MALSRDEVREILEEHDVDGDGMLTKQELMQALNSMGFSMSFQKANYGVAFADKDGDGSVDDNELEKLVDYVMRFQTPEVPKPTPQKQQDEQSTVSQLKLSRDEVREILEEHDVDGDGSLTKQEVMQALNSMGSMMSFQKAHYGVSQADKDGDGTVCLDDAEMDKLIDYIMKFQTPKDPKGPEGASPQALP